MPFIAWLLFGSGVFLMSCATLNKPPKETLTRILSGKDITNLRWFIPPVVVPGQVIGEWHEPGDSPEAGLGNQAGAGLAGGRETVIAFAKAQLGEPYVFGASGPRTWDCSGLTQQAYKQIGIKLPHHAASQQRMGKQVAEANALPGDLVFWGVVASHVGIYLGNGYVLHAPKTGDVVKISKVWDEKRRTYRSYL